MPRDSNAILLAVTVHECGNPITSKSKTSDTVANVLIHPEGNLRPTSNAPMQANSMSRFGLSRRPVSITVGTSSYEYNIKGLLNHLRNLQRQLPDLIKKVAYCQLPYNDVDKHKFTKENPVDVLILCHSIKNRRFAITDVPDACYDKFLPNCRKSIGKEKIAVIAHDFDNISDQAYMDRMMEDFQMRQPTAFDNAGLVMVCGKLDEGESLTEPSQAQLISFLKAASHLPEEVKSGMFSSIRSTCLPAMFTSGDSGKAKAPDHARIASPAKDAHANVVTPAQHCTPHSSHYPKQQPTQHPSQHHTQPPAQLPVQPPVQHSAPCPIQSCARYPSQYCARYSLQHPSQHSAQNSLQHPPQYSVRHAVPHSVQHLAQQSPPSSRPIFVSVCTSAHEYNVKGLMTRLTELKTIQPHVIADVRFRELPYNNIDSFKFPSHDPVDVMVLCHSVHNRGFAITDVMNAIYDKYLKYCSKEIGKKKLALIVHDLTDWGPTVVPVKMDTFQKTQPSTFKLVDTVVICGSLESTDELKMTETDMARLLSFFESASLEPRKKASSVFGKVADVKSKIF